MAYHRAIDAIRRRNAYTTRTAITRQASLNASEKRHMFLLPDIPIEYRKQGTPLEMAIAAERRVILLKIITDASQQLPEQYRRLFKLGYMEGTSDRDLCRTFHIPVAEVRT